MKRFFLLWIAGFLTTFGLFSFAQDDLDDVLATQKKKAQRRVYSTPAQLDEQDLVVPTGPTEQEIEIDRKLEALEKELDLQAKKNPIAQRAQPNPAITQKPLENKNWLLPAVLDSKQSEAMTTSEENSWVLKELTRQQAIREEKAALEKENELVNKRLQEEMKPKRFTESALTPQARSIVEPFTPSEILRPLPSRPKPTQQSRSRNASLFSPDYTGSEETSSSSRKTIVSPFIRTRSSEASSISWDDADKQQNSTPLKRVRRSSPIFKDDPFAEDHMPNIKTSIWD